MASKSLSSREVSLISFVFVCRKESVFQFAPGKDGLHILNRLGVEMMGGAMSSTTRLLRSGRHGEKFKEEC